MAATNLFMNWSSVSFTPTGGSALTIEEVTDVDFGFGSSLQDWYADAATFPKLSLSKELKRTAKVTTGRVAKLLTIPINTPGTFRATLDDAVNGIGTGAISFVLGPCILSDSPFKGTVNRYATGDLTFSAYAPDGITDPLTATIAS